MNNLHGQFERVRERVSLRNERSGRQSRPKSERRELRSHLFKVTYRKNGGTVRCIAFVTRETSRTDWQMDKQHTTRDVERLFTDHVFLL